MIEFAKKEDIPIIAAIESSCIRSAWTLEMLAEAFGDNAYKFFVKLDKMSDERKVVGYIYIRCVIDEAEICNIAVASDFRQKGYAKELLLKTEKYSKQNGIKTMLLEVRQSNFAALNLYKSIGFSQLAIRKNYYEDGENAIVMSKVL